MNVQITGKMACKSGFPLINLDPEPPRCYNSDFRTLWPFSDPGLWLGIRLRLALLQARLDNCTGFSCTLRAKDERTEPEATSKAEVSKSSCVSPGT